MIKIKKDWIWNFKLKYDENMNFYINTRINWILFQHIPPYIPLSKHYCFLWFFKLIQLLLNIDLKILSKQDQDLKIFCNHPQSLLKALTLIMFYLYFEQLLIKKTFPSSNNIEA